MRSFKEFLEEELISEDDDKKEDKKESKKDSEKKSEKKDEDKKEEKLVIDIYKAASGKWSKLFTKSDYDDHMEKVDDDVNKEKQMHYVWSTKVGDKSFKIDFKSTPRSETSFRATTSGIPSGLSASEKGRLLSGIWSAVDTFAEPFTGFDRDDIEGISLYLPYKSQEELENYKELEKNIHIDDFKKSSKNDATLSKLIISFLLK